MRRDFRVRGLFCLLVAVLLSSSMPLYASGSPNRATPVPPVPRATNLPEAVPGTFIVKTRSPQAPAALGGSIGVAAANVKQGRHGTFEVRTPQGKSDAQFRKELEQRPDIASVSPVYFRTVDAIALSPNDRYFNEATVWTDGIGDYRDGRSWWLQAGGLWAWALWAESGHPTWGLRAPASQFPIAVIDTGCYLTHPDLQANVVGKKDEFATYQESTGILTTDTDVTPVDPAFLGGDVREASHGTFVAGEIGATTDNVIGLASITQESPVWVYKVQGVYYNGTYPGGVGVIMDIAVINAIYDATDDGARVINLSLGGEEYSSAMQDAIDYAYSNGVLVVASVGNAGALNGVLYPAANNHVVGVGAYGFIDGSGTKAPAAFSNYGVGIDALGAGSNNGGVDILAPGCLIWGAVKPDWDEDGAGDVADPGYAFMQGTSMAAPAFAGTAALLWRFGPDLSPDHVASLFTSTAWSAGDPAQGAGYINTSGAYTAMTHIVPDVQPPRTLWCTATATGKTTIKLSWPVAFDDSLIAKYTVYLADGTPVAETGAWTYTVTGLAPGTTYGFYVTATDGVGNEGAPGPVSTATTYPEVDTTKPSPPMGTHASAWTARTISVGWNVTSDESGIATYSLYFADGTRIADTLNTQMTVDNLMPSTTYSFYVTATDTAGNESDPSTVVSATTPALPDTTPPSAPGNVVAAAISPTSIAISWDAAIDDFGISRYHVYRVENGSDKNVATVYSPTTSWTDTGLKPGTTYTYRVDAVDTAPSGHVGQKSDPASAATFADTIPPAAPVLGGWPEDWSAIGLNWSPVVDDSGIANYKVYRDGRLAATLPSTMSGNYSIRGLAPATAYTFTVVAVDGAGLCSPPSNAVTVPTMTPVYRFYRASTGTHFYTSDQAEMARVRDTMGSVYHLDGIAYSINTASQFNSVPLYRFYNRRTGTHLYTADETEKNSILASLSGTYSLDGVAYYVSMTGGIEVHRFYSPLKGVHFYSADPNEIAYVKANLGSIWQYEGPAYYLGRW